MIAFDKLGSGKPVIFLHSGLANRTMWKPQLDAFAERYTCYALDLPGYGESSTPAEAFSYPVEIARFIEQNVGQPAALVGSSFGASKVLLTAVASPAWTGPLVLADSAIMRPEAASPELTDMWTNADAAWDRGERERANEIEIEGWVDGWGRPDGRVAPAVRDYFLTANRAIWERHDAHPLPEELPDPQIVPALIQQPVLLIDGPYDLIDVRQSNRVLRQQLPNATYMSIADTAHFPSYERPEEFNRIVIEFLDRTWGAKNS